MLKGQLGFHPLLTCSNSAARSSNRSSPSPVGGRSDRFGSRHWHTSMTTVARTGLHATRLTTMLRVLRTVLAVALRRRLPT
jgi:hypothetical protein